MRVSPSFVLTLVLLRNSRQAFWSVRCGTATCGLTPCTTGMSGRAEFLPPTPMALRLESHSSRHAAYDESCESGFVRKSSCLENCEMCRQLRTGLRLGEVGNPPMAQARSSKARSSTQPVDQVRSRKLNCHHGPIQKRRLDVP